MTDLKVGDRVRLAGESYKVGTSDHPRLADRVRDATGVITLDADRYGILLVNWKVKREASEGMSWAINEDSVVLHVDPPTPEELEATIASIKEAIHD